MPELPEVETVCRGLAKACTGTRICSVDVYRHDLRMPLPENLAARLKKRRIEKITRRAKYILISLDNNETLILHLGMSGRITITQTASKAIKHDHLVFHFENGLHAYFNDPRRFGLCDLIPTKDLPQHKLFCHLGIEPLEPGLSPATLMAKFAGKKTSIKAALLDQRMVVGIGNIYACEALYHAGINPKRRASACTKEQIAKLVSAIRKVLKEAIKVGGSSLRNYVHTDGKIGSFQNRFAVYSHEHKKCPGCICHADKSGGIRRITQAGRSTFYCPTKQK
jgi:formamidopyrimidine-DNA glycosylase